CPSPGARPCEELFRGEDRLVPPGGVLRLRRLGAGLRDDQYVGLRLREGGNRHEPAVLRQAVKLLLFPPAQRRGVDRAGEAHTRTVYQHVVRLCGAGGLEVVRQYGYPEVLLNVPQSLDNLLVGGEEALPGGREQVREDLGGVVVGTQVAAHDERGGCGRSRRPGRAGQQVAVTRDRLAE